MSSGSVRPAKQRYPADDDVAEFATVGIITGPSADWGTWSTELADDLATGSTKIVETIDNVYKFTASIQFFRHATPANGRDGLPVFGLGALDKATRLEARLASESMMELMEQMGLGIESSSDPIDVAAIVNDTYYEDRGSVNIVFVIVNREQFLIESVGSAEVTLKVAEPGKVQPTTETIEVTP
jgi:hypothetical protein